jgi:hypothetical protein
LTAPSGEHFTTASTKSFSSLDAAFSYLTGTWHGTYRFLPSQPQRPFEFSVALVSTDSLMRELPLNVSLNDGDRVRNGEQFLFSWDYDFDEANRSTYWALSTVINSMHVSRGFRISLTPPPGPPIVSGGSGGNFSTRYETVPSGTAENRLLTTFTVSGSPSQFPVEVELTMGAATHLHSAITNAPPDDLDPFIDPPTFGLTYVRKAAPINFQIIPIPEPASWALAGVAIGTVRLLRRRLL